MDNKKTVVTNISNRHIHLSQADADTLFGSGYCLVKVKDLMQTGEHACAETVVIKGPKGEISKVRVLGPIRKNTQVEISISDSIKLGVNAPVRLSGDLAGSAAITIIGSNGTVELKEGCVVAKRHVHMSLEEAQKYNIKDRDVLSLKVGSERAVTFHDVIARVSPNMKLECHLDIEEANAAGIKNGDIAVIL